MTDPFAASRPLMARLELAEAWQNARFVEELRRTKPASGAEVRPVGSGLALFAGPNTPMSQALGLGLSGPVDAAQLDSVEELLGRGGGPIVISLLPAADPTLAALLAERRYRIGEFNQVLVRTLAAASARAPASVLVRAIEPSEVELWARTVTAGFLEREEASLSDAPWLTPKVPAGTTSFLAFDGARAIGAGSISIEGDIAILSGTSVLPSARFRGTQLALIEARLEHARRAGCELATSSTLPGTSSQRNLERAGFRVNHCKAMLTRDPASRAQS